MVVVDKEGVREGERLEDKVRVSAPEADKNAVIDAVL